MMNKAFCRLVKRRNKQKRAQRREHIPPSPPPHYLPIFIQPFFHGEELPRCRVRRSRGWDGMGLRQIGQSKVSSGVQSRAPHGAAAGHQCS
ncbi:hypothetical protein NQZ68_016860 [Dissostichus eleginoides]|nr:hypothetical protein NQZ68_016860 [Dissostichus eleginoides]